MVLIEGDSFDQGQCLAFFGRSRLGRIALTLQALPVVFPVSYLVVANGFLVGVSVDQIAEAMDPRVIALEADGWAEDEGRRWTALAIGFVERVEVHDEYPRPGVTDVTAGRPWNERHVFRLQPSVLSGRWIAPP